MLNTFINSFVLFFITIDTIGNLPFFLSLTEDAKFKKRTQIAIKSTIIAFFILIAFAGSILLTISAKIKIPFYPVPMTMQTFVVILLGITFGYKAGAAAVCLYLIEGISGLPVFSNSPEKGVGLSYFMGPTMGYLIGFIFAAVIAGYLKYTKNYIFTAK